MLRRMGMGMAVVVAAVLVLAAPATAQYNDQDPTTSIVGGTTFTPGAPVTVTSGPFCPGATITWTFEPGGTTLGTSTADANGDATYTGAIPMVEPGDYTITATGIGADCVTVKSADAVLSVVAARGVDNNASGPSATSSLPRTGSNTETWVRVGIVLVAAGLLLVLASRRRRATV